MTDQPSKEAVAVAARCCPFYFGASENVHGEENADCGICQRLARALDEFRAAGVADYEEVLADKRRLVRELDAALHGEDGAAKQASLCDLIKPARDLRQERDELRAQNAELQARVEAEHDLADVAKSMLAVAEREWKAQLAAAQEDSARWQLLCAKALAGVRMYRDGNMELGGITFAGVREAERAIDAARNQEGAEDE